MNCKSNCGNTTLMYASEYGNYECMKTLIQTGADVKTTNHEGKMALYISTVNCFSKCVGWLIKSGADTTDPVSGNSILHDIASTRRYQCVVIMLAAGVFINIKNNLGQNALKYHLVKHRYEREDIVKLLYAAGEILNEKQNLQPKAEICLTPSCRKAIWKHLLNLDSHLNLFHRIPKLGLPTRLAEYLLYDVKLNLK